MSILLSFIQASLGVYRPILYYKGQSRYGSLLSVIFSIFFGLIFLIGAVSILADIFRRAHYSKTQKDAKIAEVEGLADLTISEATDILKLKFFISVNATLPQADCSDFSLLVWDAHSPQSNVTDWVLIQIPFVEVFRTNENYTLLDCQSVPFENNQYLEYLRVNASTSPAFYQADATFGKGTCLSHVYGIASLQSEIPIIGMKLGFHTKSLLEGGLVLNDDYVKQVIPQQGKYTSNSEFLFFLWNMEVTELSISNGVMGETLSSVGVGDAFNRMIYLAVDGVESYQWTMGKGKQEYNPLITQNFFCFKNRVVQTKVAPDSIFRGLAQIGGLLGLMRLFRFLSNYQERRFERELQKDLDGQQDQLGEVEGQQRLLVNQTESATKEQSEEGEKNVSIKEFYSLETFKAMHESIQEMKGTILELKAKMKSLEERNS
ncbi:hypothetical protein FGO68_gene3274 [Halteria grandinella]|uniref:Uncharacterized protein n=1 Tax=Halteria grandinella TaxID=5974 RepID=A0A8J8T1N7_HALGN|nr:hypothetical protein FGO68_gene3274 [Halteria grandinella]